MKNMSCKKQSKRISKTFIDIRRTVLSIGIIKSRMAINEQPILLITSVQSTLVTEQLLNSSSSPLLARSGKQAASKCYAWVREWIP